MILRVVAAGALGGLIGFEREFREHAAGFRTHILVSMGAALFTLVGAYGVESFAGAGDGIRVTFDPTRVAAQVVTGIGFLGAGAIMRQGVNVRGLTTAAALWVTAAIGTAVALGYWVGAIATAVGALIALTALRWIENVVFPACEPTPSASSSRRRARCSYRGSQRSSRDMERAPSRSSS